MNKAWVFSDGGRHEFPESDLDSVIADVELHNRNHPPEKWLVLHIGPEPPKDLVFERGRLREMNVAEKVAASVIELGPMQKLDGDEIVEKSVDELVAEGILSRADVKERVDRRLRLEVSAHFEQHRTPSGYAVDQLARQKASFSYPFRTVLETDLTKHDLLEMGLIYPNAVLDEILSEVQKASDAYRTAKRSLEQSYAAGGAPSSLEKITTGLGG